MVPRNIPLISFLLVSFATNCPNDIFAKLPPRQQSRVGWSRAVWCEIPALLLLTWIMLAQLLHFSLHGIFSN